MRFLNVLVPFDYEASNKAEEFFAVGTTDCYTREPIYYNNKEHGKDSPNNPLKVGRMERSRNRVTELFHEGYENGKRHYSSLVEWLGK
jgi:hypothetical protein